MRGHARQSFVPFIGVFILSIARSVDGVVDPNAAAALNPQSLPNATLSGFAVAEVSFPVGFSSPQAEPDASTGRPRLGFFIPVGADDSIDPELAEQLQGYLRNCSYAAAIDDRLASLRALRTSYRLSGADFSYYAGEFAFLESAKQTTDALDCPAATSVGNDTTAVTGDIDIGVLGGDRRDIYPGFRFALPHTGARSDYGFDLGPTTIGQNVRMRVPLAYLGGVTFGDQYRQADGSLSANFVTPRALYGMPSGTTETPRSALEEMAFHYIDWQTGPRPVDVGTDALADSRFPGRSISYGGSVLPIKFGDEFAIGDRHYLAVRNDPALTAINGFRLRTDPFRRKLLPRDPHFKRTAGQGQEGQWAIKRVGLSDDDSSAWNALPANASATIVAVIDSGLDWHHQDLDWRNLWRNEDEIEGNGVDDDDNGYVDDIIGWNFVSNDNYPWDLDGHGTLVTGIIAAAHNDAGIAGIDPNAKIMVVKAVNDAGVSRASLIARSIVYATDNGARIINLSVGGEHRTEIEQRALAYARQRNVLVIVATGNEGKALTDYALAAEDNVIGVGATFGDDRAATFSNFGEGVDLAAPGVDVLGLRARFTDTNYAADAADYTIGTHYVGADSRYIRASGTSFATPIVTGVASLVLSARPHLNAEQVEQILFRSAEDLDFPGHDQHTGYGLVDARRALLIDPDFHIDVSIKEVKLVRDKDDEALHVDGTVDADALKRAWITIGLGDNPTSWKRVGRKLKRSVVDGELASVPRSDFTEPGRWQLVVNAEHKNGIVRRAARMIDIR